MQAIPQTFLFQFSTNPQQLPSYRLQIGLRTGARQQASTSKPGLSPIPITVQPTGSHTLQCLQNLTVSPISSTMTQVQATITSCWDNGRSPSLGSLFLSHAAIPPN